MLPSLARLLSLFCGESSQSQRSQNGLSWKGPYRSSSSNPPAMGRATFHQTRVLKALSTARAEASTSSLTIIWDKVSRLILKAPTIFLTSCLCFCLNHWISMSYCLTATMVYTVPERGLPCLDCCCRDLLCWVLTGCHLYCYKNVCLDLEDHAYVLLTMLKYLLSWAKGGVAKWHSWRTSSCGSNSKFDNVNSLTSTGVHVIPPKSS